jgi:hypothetical protein
MVLVGHSTLLTNSDAVAVRLQAHGFLRPAAASRARLTNENFGTCRKWLRAMGVLTSGAAPVAAKLLLQQRAVELRINGKRRYQRGYVAGLKGDSAAYRAFLSGLSGHPRRMRGSKRLDLDNRFAVSRDRRDNRSQTKARATVRAAQSTWWRWFPLFLHDLKAAACSPEGVATGRDDCPCIDA